MNPFYTPIDKSSFAAAIDDHINSAPTVIRGTYRGTISVTHYYNPATGLWAAEDAAGNLVAAWKLAPSQVKWLLKTGSIK